MKGFMHQILLEHAELTGRNVTLNWQIEQYERLINELMAYLCQEDILGEHYINRFNSLMRIKRSREENDDSRKKD